MQRLSRQTLSYTEDKSIQLINVRVVYSVTFASLHRGHSRGVGKQFSYKQRNGSVKPFS